MFLVSTAMCVIHNFRSIKIKSISRKKNKKLQILLRLIFQDVKIENNFLFKITATECENKIYI